MIKKQLSMEAIIAMRKLIEIRISNNKHKEEDFAHFKELELHLGEKNNIPNIIYKYM